tara:strand:- start:1025 stop:2077 length:1053 start_codon:yes stop_codon:yes gene_type:complete
MIAYQLSSFGQPLQRFNFGTPDPGPNEILVRVLASGVCHSDLHLRDGYFDLGDGQTIDLSKGRSLPLTLGHEIAGEVVAVGTSVSSDLIGKKRVIYPWIGCGACFKCSNGDEHLCSSPEALGVVRDGGFADYVVVPHKRYLIDFGGISEKVSCTYACSGLTAYRATREIRTAMGDRSVVVIGAGGVGLAVIATLKALCENKVIICDIDDDRLRAAENLGADIAINSGSELRHKLRDHTAGGAGAVVDCVGSVDSSGLGIKTLAQGGTMIVVGLFGGALKLRLPLLPLKQLTLKGSYVGSLKDMEELALLVRTGKLPPLPIVERSLSDAQQALDELEAGRAIGRIVLRPDL